jgi:hypothetical protein
MSYVLPANRSNQHIARYRAELYMMPRTDKTGILSALTERANEVLTSTRYKYCVGMRVYAVTQMREPVIGYIDESFEGVGMPLYHVKDDNGKFHTIAQNGVKFVLSIVVSTQHTQDSQLAA